MKIIYDLLDKFLMNDNQKEIFDQIINKKEKIIFDIGCFRGKFTSKCQETDKLNINRYYLFDPNPNVPNYIEEMIKKNNNINFFNYGFSNKREEEIFYINNFFEASGSSFQKYLKDDKLWHLSRRLFVNILNILTFKKINGYSSIKVKTDTIDDFCEKNEIDKIDLLKIDTEGHEEFVLKGAELMIKNKKIDVIYTEILENKKMFETKKKRLISYLNKFGFKFIKEFPIKSVSFLSNSKSSDLLFKIS